MNAWSNYFHGRYGASRAYLLEKALLLTLALDTFQLMIGHAGRYGIDGFNVAHFRWLDAVQPLPSAASYIAVLLLTGLLALVLVCTGIRRAPALLLFALYTFSWSMSMLDSYQHHYFVSIVLLCLAFFPRTSAHQIHPSPAASSPRGAHAELHGWLYVACLSAIVLASIAIDAGDHRWVAVACFTFAAALATWFYSPPEGRTPAQTAGFGYPLLGASIAIVYAFTALAKADANWMQGHTLLRISEAERVFAPLADLGARLGVPRERVWSWISTLVIPQEAALGCCYLIATTQDRTQRRWPRMVSLVGFGLALVLHIGAEAMELQIGWFSYYMLLLACCYLLPLSVVDRLATLFTWPARRLELWASAWSTCTEANLTGRLAAILLGCLLLALTAARLGLPGTWAACGIAGAVLLAVSARHMLRSPARDPSALALATGCAAIGMWIAIATSSARWDFYRYLGGDLKRRGKLSAALVAYERGEAYAPEGQTRAKQISEIRRSLERGGSR